ncbi:MAG: type II 3-dehydroquinate dehydratase [Bacilli bacterium]|nr:type II 3-dehydroquinate dehydratase [Bacilli bacterium]MDD7315360.1 type II 3-dehydroquinate dehydratase [Bacilli bacterium]MDY4052799.1 type II 3-dehydroquinate dehydratase [Bacilli bacterium]
MKILIINGPNLNFLGIREPSVYGSKTYDDLTNFLNQEGSKRNINLDIRQTNHEGLIIDYIQEAYFNKYDGIIINPGGYTHYSVAIRDAISSVMIPTIEVHLSNILEREDFRKISLIKDVCVKSIYGKGFDGYLEALEYFYKKENQHE